MKETQKHSDVVSDMISLCSSASTVDIEESALRFLVIVLKEAVGKGKGCMKGGTVREEAYKSGCQERGGDQHLLAV